MFVWRPGSGKYHHRVIGGTLCRISKLNTTAADQAILGEEPPADRVLCSNCVKAADGIRAHRERKAQRENHCSPAAL